jgi:hypothetical protein
VYNLFAINELPEVLLLHQNNNLREIKMEDKKMKTLKFKIAGLLLILTFFFGLTSAKAENSFTGKEAQLVSNSISYPAFAKENSLQGDVTVIFGIDEQGGLKVFSASSKVPVLADYVSSNFSDLKFENLEKGKLYRIVISFNLL